MAPATTNAFRSSIQGNSPDLSSFVSKFCDETQDSKRRRDGEASIAYDHYVGNQWLRFDQRSLTVWSDQELFNGGLIINASAPVIDSIDATVCAQSLIPEGVAITSDPEDARSAEVGTIVGQDHYYRMGGPAAFNAIAHFTVLTGDCFVMLGYDPYVPGTVVMSGDELNMWSQMSQMRPISVSPVANDKYRAVLPVGGTTETIVNAELFLIENGCRNFRECRRFGVVEYMTVYDAQQMFPNADPEFFQPISIPNRRSFWKTRSAYSTTQPWDISNQQTGTRFDTRAAITGIVKFWQKSGPTWDCNVFTGYGLEHQVDEQRGLPIHPYVHYGYRKTDTFWHKSAYKDMRLPQFVLNKMVHRKMQHLQNGVKDRLYIPFNATNTPTNDDVVVIEYDPMTQTLPQYIPVDTTLYDLLTRVEDHFKATLLELGQVSAVAMGNMPDRASGAAIRQEVEVNSGPFLEVRGRLKASEEEKYQKQLFLAQQYYGLPRLTPMVGDWSERAVNEFSRADILAGTTMRVIERDLTPQGKKARTDVAIQLFQYGLFNPDMAEAAENMNRFISSGDVQAVVSPDAEQNKKQAATHFQWILDGKVGLAPAVVNGTQPEPGAPPTFTDPNAPAQVQPMVLVNLQTMAPLVADYQMHDVQARQNVQDLMRPEMDYNPQAKQMLTQLLNEHQQKLAEAAQAAAEQQAQQAAMMSQANNSGQIQSIQAAGLVDAAKGGAGEGGGPSTKSPASGGQTTAREDANVGTGKGRPASD